MALRFLPAKPTEESLRYKTWVGYGMSKKEARKIVGALARQDIRMSECGTYQATLTDVPARAGWPPMVWISFKRVDREPIFDWRIKQEIKNALVGPEREACELFPAESRLVDESNQYHLWALPEGMAFPFGYQKRSVTVFVLGKSKQRPFQIQGEI